MSHQQEQTWKFFEQNPLTHSAAHYLMTIKELHDEFGYARATDVASKLDITKGSCSLSLKSLKKRGLISDDKNRFLKLSEAGNKLVERVSQNEELLENFLKQVLGIDSWQAEIDACKMEHLLSSETSRKLAAFMHFIKTDHKIVHEFLQEFNKKKPSCDLNPRSCKVCEKICWLNCQN